MPPGEETIPTGGAVSTRPRIRTANSDCCQVTSAARFTGQTKGGAIAPPFGTSNFALLLDLPVGDVPCIHVPRGGVRVNEIAPQSIHAVTVNHRNVHVVVD